MGLAGQAAVPDAKTIWLFRKRLTEAAVIEELFQQFEPFLQATGYAAQGGQSIDASIIPVPIQRNSREENKQIKAGNIPPEWEQPPHKLAQKDGDARTKKNGKSYYGYKSHLNTDVSYGFMRQHRVTDAAVHDAQEFDQILDPDNADDGMWADSAYRSEANETQLALEGYESQIHEKASRNPPLSEAQKAANQEKSKIRAKVEHVFGCWVTSMGGKLVRCMGLERVTAYLGLRDLAYNLQRYVFWQKRKLWKAPRLRVSTI